MSDLRENYDLGGAPPRVDAKAASALYDIADFERAISKARTDAQQKKRIELLDRVMASAHGGNPFLDMAMDELRDELVERIYQDKELYAPCSECRGVGTARFSSSGEACSSCNGTGRGPLRT